MLATPFVVKVTDRNGRNVAGASVTFASTGGGAVTPTTAKTDSSGLPSTTITLPLSYSTASYTATVDSLAPVTTQGTSHGAAFGTISAGLGETCATTVEGYLYCWGDNAALELGLPNHVQMLTPQPMQTPALFAVVRQGSLSGCGIDKAGHAWCWGNTQFGLLGDGTGTVGSSPPVRVSGHLTFRDLSVTTGYACGVTTSGAIYCWGLSAFGEGGPVNGTGNLTPTPISSSASFLSISAANTHTCAIATDSTAYCWGSNADSSLGTTATLSSCDGTLCSSSPVAVAGGLHFQSISAGYTTTCGLTTGGVGYCWGKNDLGQIGDGTQVDEALPTQVAAGGQPLQELEMSGNMACALTTTQTILCWGDATYDFLPYNGCPVQGQPGATTACQPTPTAVSTPGFTFSNIAVGGEGNLCGIPVGSTRLYCWGSNSYGVLGDSTGVNATAPTLVSDQQ